MGLFKGRKKDDVFCPLMIGRASPFLMSDQRMIWHYTGPLSMDLGKPGKARSRTQIIRNGPRCNHDRITKADVWSDVEHITVSRERQHRSSPRLRVEDHSSSGRFGKREATLDVIYQEVSRVEGYECPRCVIIRLHVRAALYTIVRMKPWPMI
jgi:hypothetical protein